MSACLTEIQVLESGLGGRVRVGTVLTPSTGLLSEAILKLTAGHDRLQVAVEVDTSTRLIQDLRAGRLDIVPGRILAEPDEVAARA